MTILDQGIQPVRAERGRPRRPVAVGREIRAALRSRPSLLLATAFIGVLLILAVCAPLWAALEGFKPNDFHPEALLADGSPAGGLGGISSQHWFGVEPLNGRDIFARIVYGARTSLFIAVLATLLTMTFGVVMGTLAGFFGGVIDQVISRVMDFLMAFPALIFMIAVLSAVPQANRILMLILVLSIFGWSKIGRIIRSQAMSLRHRDFVEAAEASGASKWAMIFREVIPNMIGTILVYASLTFPSYIATEAGLSFLGVGVRAPDPSWGQMIFGAVSWYQTDPMFFIIPGAFLTCTVLASMIIGDHLEMRLNRRESV